MRTCVNHFMTIAASCLFLSGLAIPSPAAELFDLVNLLTGNGKDVATHDCDKCGYVHGAGEKCVGRYAVEDCVVGKKKVYDCKVRYEWVSIPETRYHLKKQLVTKKIPCPYCKPVCKTEAGQHCFGQEKWEKFGTKCEQLHCKHIEPQLEKESRKHCEHVKGETTITVKYWSCVEVPYTVYRQVKRPVCVKQPHYEKVNVPVTRYVCEHCQGDGCSHCEN